MRCAALLVMLGCGRVGFGVATDGRVDDGSIDAGPVAFAYVQSSFTCTNQQTSVDVVLPLAQTRGNFNVVAVGIDDLITTITDITDTAGNTYTLGVGPHTAGAVRQWMYYAVPIVDAASNTITVHLNQNGLLVGVTVAEYSGVSPTDPIDNTAGGGDDSTNSDSGAVTVSGPALLVGANTNAQGGTAGPGPLFTQRVLTDYEDILEDRVVMTGGNYRADAPLTGQHNWVMQMLALRPR